MDDNLMHSDIAEAKQRYKSPECSNKEFESGGDEDIVSDLPEDLRDQFEEHLKSIPEFANACQC